MATEPKTVPTLTEIPQHKSKTLLRCPQCHATKFQGPFQRGQFVNGKFVPETEVWQCLGCNRQYDGTDGLEPFEVNVTGS